MIGAKKPRTLAIASLSLALLAGSSASRAQNGPEGLAPIFLDGFESGDYFGWSRARTGSADIVDPTLEITEPVENVLFNQHTTPVTVLFADADSGLDIAGLRVFVDSFRLDPDCVVSTSSAECQTPFLNPGPHELVASVWDLAGNRAQVRHSFEVVIDTQPPLISITSPTDGGFVNTPSVEVVGTVTEADVVASVEVNGMVAVVAGDTFSATVALSPGENLIRVDATDRAGNTGAVTTLVELDTVLPELSLIEPVNGAWSNEASIRFAGSSHDELSAVSLTIAGNPVVLQGEEFEVQVPLVEGANSILVEARDEAGNATSRNVLVRRLTVPSLTITSPEDGSLVNTAAVDVVGTVSDPAASVAVNGVSAGVNASGGFAATGVGLNDGSTILSAVATLPSGSQSSAKVKVFRDIEPPRVTIYEPQDGDLLLAPEVDVLGLVNDTVLGTVGPSQVTVMVNGAAAEVSHRSFFLPSVALQAGENLLTVVAEDASGNQASTSLRVFHEAPSQAWISVEGGSRQTATIGAALAAPLQARPLDQAGVPVAGETVVFSVVQGNGTLAGGGRFHVAVTDGAGIAQTSFTLGSRAGVANHRVEATAVGFAGRAVFLASALSDAPALVHVDGGSQQRGVTNQFLPAPLAVIVTDTGFNRLPGVPVLFEVAQGLGTFPNGASSISVPTDSDGRAAVAYRLGPEEGSSNEVVTAGISGSPSIAPATFVASGLAAGDPAQTSVSGLVLDNANHPVPGVTLGLANTTLRTQTDDSGFFSLTGTPVGTLLLEVDGTTTTLPGAWPELEFELTTIPGRDNGLGTPIYLLPLDVARGLQVSDTEGGVLMLPELPGFSLDIEPGSVTFPDGSHSGMISATLVHGDKVPMVPNFGQQPTFIVTIQPSGSTFDPPARINLPNTDGLAPGEVTELYSFDHDLGRFVSIGPGSVSQDGTVIASDPGVGVLKAGWHCGGNPARFGTPHDCPQCKVCNGSRCVPGCSTLAGGGESLAQSEGLPVLGCTCDDRNPCTVNDTCSNGNCRGRPIRFDSVTVTADGQQGTLEIPFLGIRTAPVTFNAQIAPVDHGCPQISYFWQFQDGGFETGKTVTHSFNRTGQFNPTVSVRCDVCRAARTTGSTSVDVFEIAMLFEKVGDTEISDDGMYTEDTTIRVTAVRADTGVPYPSFQGTVEIQEEGSTTYYEENGGDLPASVQIQSEGTSTFVAKSQAGLSENGQIPTEPALISSSNYPIFGSSLEVSQWVDLHQVDPRSTGPVFDWLEARMRDIFDEMGGNGQVGEALATVTSYEISPLPGRAVGSVAFNRSSSHVMKIDTSKRFEIRVPGEVFGSACFGAQREALTLVVIHEARHGYQDFLSTIDLESPDEFPGRPNNDDDQDWLFDAVPSGACPCTILLDTEDIRQGCDQTNNIPIGVMFMGDGEPDAGREPGYAWEMDAIQFSINNVMPLERGSN